MKALRRPTPNDPLLLFSREGDCLTGKLPPGNLCSADGWEELLLPEDPEGTPWQQEQGRQTVKITRLSCRRLRSNEVRLWLSVIACNLGNLRRRASKQVEGGRGEGDVREKPFEVRDFRVSAYSAEAELAPSGVAGVAREGENSLTRVCAVPLMLGSIALFRLGGHEARRAEGSVVSRPDQIQSTSGPTGGTDGAADRLPLAGAASSGIEIDVEPSCRCPEQGWSVASVVAPMLQHRLRSNNNARPSGWRSGLGGRLRTSRRQR